MVMVLFLWLASLAHASIRVAITVDDLPIHSSLPASVSRVAVAKKMIAVLAKAKIPEVYGFINAKKREDAPDTAEVLKLWVQAGYPLGNHTYSHKSVNKVSSKEFQDEILRNEKTVDEFNGEKNGKVFRYPYLHEGNTKEKRDAARTFLKEHGYKIAEVTIDFEDWSWNDPYARCKDKNSSPDIAWLKQTYLQNAVDQLQRADALGKALFKRSIAHILLLHIGAFDAEMIEELVNRYQAEGVEFVPLSEALKDEIYLQDPGAVYDWGAEFTFQVMKARSLKLKDLGLEPYLGYPKEKLASVCR